MAGLQDDLASSQNELKQEQQDHAATVLTLVELRATLYKFRRMFVALTIALGVTEQRAVTAEDTVRTLRLELAGASAIQTEVETQLQVEQENFKRTIETAEAEHQIALRKHQQMVRMSRVCAPEVSGERAEESISEKNAGGWSGCTNVNQILFDVHDISDWIGCQRSRDYDEENE